MLDNSINKHELAPLQAEKNEWMMAPDGQLVKSAATKLHKNMKDDDVTDFMPEENTFIFSNDKKMKLKKKDFEEAIMGYEFIDYKEGQTTKPPKELTFADYFTSKENTPAEIAKGLAKKYKVLNDNDAYMDNPFIKKANKLNMETRSKPLEVLKMVNDLQKAKVEGSTNTQQELQQIEQYRYGGYNRKKTPKYQKGGDFASGFISGGSAGLATGNPFAALALGVGGGVFNMFTGSKQDKEAKRKEAERAALFAQQRVDNENRFAASNATTFAKAAVPIPEYHNLNLDAVKARANSAYNRLQLSENSRRNAAYANSAAIGNTNLRSLAGAGVDSTLLQNVANNNNAKAIQGSNAQGLAYDNYYDKVRLDQMGTLNSYDEALARDKQFGLNQTGDRKYDKAQNVVGEFGNNYQNYSKAGSQLNIDDYTSMLGLADANAANRAGAIANNNNWMTTAGSSITGALNAAKYRELIDAQIAGIGAGDVAGAATSAASAPISPSSSIGSTSTATPNSYNSTAGYANPFNPMSLYPGSSANTLVTGPDGKSYFKDPNTGELYPL